MYSAHSRNVLHRGVVGQEPCDCDALGPPQHHREEHLHQNVGVRAGAGLAGRIGDEFDDLI